MRSLISSPNFNINTQERPHLIQFIGFSLRFTGLPRNTAQISEINFSLVSFYHVIRKLKRHNNNHNSWTKHVRISKTEKFEGNKFKTGEFCFGKPWCVSLVYGINVHNV